MRLLLLIAFATFLLFGAMPGQSMAGSMDMEHATDCIACDMDMHHGTSPELGTCYHMTACGLAMLPDLPVLATFIAPSQMRLNVPVSKQCQGVSLSCDLPPPRA